jgi:hypothetical protein
MKIKNLIDEDFVNYKKPSMFIGTSSCDFKCDKECSKPVCQNSELAKAPTIDIETIDLVARYFTNSITEAIVLGGLEPFDSFGDICEFLSLIAASCSNSSNFKIPDIIIYTGYYPEEIQNKLQTLKIFNTVIKNIIIKFGRFIPDRPHKYDELLGIELASDNQFAKRLEDC